MFKYSLQIGSYALWQEQSQWPKTQEMCQQAMQAGERPGVINDDPGLMEIVKHKYVGFFQEAFWKLSIEENNLVNLKQIGKSCELSFRRKGCVL